MYNLSDQVKLTKVVDHSAANTTTITSGALDMAGYGGVLFISSYGTAAADNIAHVEQCDTTGGSYAALLGTAVASGTSDEDVWIDVNRPRERFLKFVGVRGTSSTLESVWALQYDPTAEPVDNTISGTIVGEAHLGNIEGTA